MVEEAPELTPLVKALTRAPTLFGVPYMFAMFNGCNGSHFFGDQKLDLAVSCFAHSQFRLFSYVA